MELFGNIKKSVYSPTYYQELQTKPFSYSLSYYFKFSLLASFVLAITFSTIAFFTIQTFAQKSVPEILEKYPTELEVKIQNGKASTNVTEPYFIKTPPSQKNQADAKENLLVIDTKSDVGFDSFKEYNAYVLLTEKSLIIQKDNEEFSMYSLEEIGDFTINKDELFSFWNTAQKYLPWILPILLVTIFIGLMFLAAFRMIYFFFAALLVWAVASIKNVPLGYQKSYQLTLHLSTLPTVITFIPIITFRFLFSLLIIGLAILNIRKVEVLPEASPEKPDNATPPASPSVVI